MPVKCESRQTKPAAFLTFIPHHKMHPILGNWKGQSANFPVHPINTPQFVTTTWLWNVHLSSSEKKLLCTLIFCATTPKGDKQNFVAEITMNVLKRYGYTFSSIGLWQTAGLVRVHTKPKSLSHSNQTKFKGVYGQSSFPWTAESKCFYAMPLVFSSNVNECWKWMRST